jgi:hypothetical protein
VKEVPPYDLMDRVVRYGRGREWTTMDEEELQEEMKGLIDEGVRNETPWQKRIREAKQRDYKITRVLSSLLLLGRPILLIVIVLGGILMYSTFGWFATILWVAIIIVLLVFC